MKSLILMFLVLVLLGCSTSKENQLAALRTYKGQTEKQVIAQLGLPSSAYDSDGKRYLIYTEENNAFLPGGFTDHPTISSGFIHSSCDNVFMLEKDKVIKVGVRGNCS